MGGTEMEKALDAVFSMGGSDAPPTILLITDGEIHEHEKLVKRAANSGHRIFTVGVGTSVAEVFLKSLSRVTQGACELVTPQEGMAERVLSQFHRMRQPKLGELRIEWPVSPEWETLLPEAVFAGDTVHVFAGFEKSIEGNVVLKATGGADVTTAVSLTSEIEIPRIAAARRMEAATDVESLRLALDYQLLSRWTNFLVIAERADKAEDLPELHQVPQMLAAGWGGTSSARVVPRCSSLRSGAMAASGIDKYDIPAFLCRQSDGPSDAMPAYSSDMQSFDFSLDLSDVSMPSPRNAVRKLRSPSRSEKLRPVGSMLDSGDLLGSPSGFMLAMEQDMTRCPSALPRTISELQGWGLDPVVAESLRRLVVDGHAEPEVVAAFIYALTQSAVSERFGRAFKRVILKGWKHVVPGQSLDRDMKESLANVTADAWNWVSIYHEVAVLP